MRGRGGPVSEEASPRVLPPVRLTEGHATVFPCGPESPTHFSLRSFPRTTQGRRKTGPVSVPPAPRLNTCLEPIVIGGLQPTLTFPRRTVHRTGPTTGTVHTYTLRHTLLCAPEPQSYVGPGLPVQGCTFYQPRSTLSVTPFWGLGVSSGGDWTRSTILSSSEVDTPRRSSFGRSHPHPSRRSQPRHGGQPVRTVSGRSVCTTPVLRTVLSFSDRPTVLGT